MDKIQTWQGLGLDVESDVNILSIAQKLRKWKQAEISYSPCRHQTVQEKKKRDQKMFLNS